MKKNKFLVPLNRNWKKLLLTMKLCLLFLLISATSLMANSGYSQNTTLSIHLKNATLRDLISEVEKQSEFIFVFYDEVVDLDRQIDVQVENQTIDKILDKIFKSSELTYQIFDRQIGIGKRDPVTGVIELPATLEELMAAEKKLTGVVKDIKGEPIPGATIIVKGTTIGTITDGEGNFILQVPADSKILVVSFVGYKKQEVEIGDQTSFSVSLQEEAIGLEEVVAVGYGVQKKKSIVGAISQVSNADLQRTGNVTNMTQALTGQLPGVITITSDAQPGGYTNQQNSTAIFIRGMNTWNGGQALVLVDGVERPMDKIDVSEVENISVLKDASATAVYGVRGANGVVLITTKRGKVGKPKLSFSYNVTALKISKLPQQYDSYGAQQLRNEAIEREVSLNPASWSDYIPYEMSKRYQLPQTAEYAAIYPNVDWVKETFKPMGFSHRSNLNVSGGNNFVSYFGSMAYLHEGDMLTDKYHSNKGFDSSYAYDRLNFRSNFDFNLTKTTKLSVNFSGNYGVKNTNIGGVGYENKMWTGAYGMPPDIFLPQYSDGRWGFTDRFPVENPIVIAKAMGVQRINQTQLNSDFALEQKLDFITKGLSAKASLFYDNIMLSSGNPVINSWNDLPTQSGANLNFKIIHPELYKGPNQDPSEYTVLLPQTGGMANSLFGFIEQPLSRTEEGLMAEQTSRRLMYQIQLNYERKFGLHNVGAMGVFKRQQYALGSMFPSYREDWVSRVTYNYDTRYFLEVNGAYNGSEQFGPGYRFAFFPSVGLGWNVANEKFMKNIDWISNLKPRYSIGKVGDDNVSGGRWLYSDQYTYGGNAWLGTLANTNSPYINYKQAVLGNPNIQWEKAVKQNLGLDIGLFDNMLSSTLEYFTEDRTDILLAGASRAVPTYFGAMPPPANVGRVKAHGYEVEIKLDKRTAAGLRYWATYSFTHTENKVLFRDDAALYYDYQKQAGFMIGQTKSQIVAGYNKNWDDIYASVPLENNDLQKLPGSFNIIDFNGDGKVKTNDNPPTKYSSLPQNTFNFSLGSDYKGFSVMLQFYGVSNVTKYYPLLDWNTGAGNITNLDIIFQQPQKDGYWSKYNQDPNAAYLPGWKTKAVSYTGDYWLLDASYLRLKTAEIAYTFGGNLIKKLGLSTLKVYLNGNNLIFWSKVPDDREGTLLGNYASMGGYPTTKRYNLGIDLSF
jgi:TonB-linked SusC/RagA family outer membrane protein